MRAWTLARIFAVLAFAIFVATMYLRPAPLSHHWGPDSEADVLPQPAGPQSANQRPQRMVELSQRTGGGGMKHKPRPGGKAIPKVALLFLTRGAMPLEPVWREFMQAASAIEPIDIRAFAAKDVLEGVAKPTSASQPVARRRLLKTDQSGGSESSKRDSAYPDAADLSGVARRQPQLLMAHASRGGHTDVIAQQTLFSVYVHSAPGYSYAPGNLFAGYEVPGRIQVFWGQFSVVEAERVLLRVALKDPLNQRFLLLSETCLPIYPPQVLYAQVMSEVYSRVNACNLHTIEDARRRSVERWHPHMQTDQLDRRHWRKSSQFFLLKRNHAAVIAADQHVAPRFEAECYSYLPGRDDGLPVPPVVQQLLDANLTVAMRTCISDEHYVPTVLAMHGFDDETDCLGMMTHAEWEWPNWSPKTYTPYEVTTQLVRRLRRLWFQNKECDWQAAIRSANTLFCRRDSRVPLSQLHNGKQQQKAFKEYMPLDHACSLIARKFDISSIDPVLRMGAVYPASVWFSPQVRHGVRCAAYADTGLESIDASSLAARIADNYYALQHPAERNMLYSRALKDFARSAILAYECGWTEELVLAELTAADNADLVGQVGLVGQEFKQADCMLCLSIVWITLLLSPRNSVNRWSTGAAVSEATMSAWGGFVKMITSAYFEKRVGASVATLGKERDDEVAELQFNEFFSEVGKALAGWV
ncbi:hypothetical protein WJX72_000912 [[Myrmecia] bisecta]|uniref:DUF7876 domain-containing protein n=1 Tax=[Myrmecia] bisecta TaxID=41462 RepID=A0AAW1PWT2_9CHLO